MKNNYVEDNFVRTKFYDKCKGCDGEGEGLASVSYYDKAYEKCYWCNGTGYKFREEKVMTRAEQPFPLAKD